MTTFKELFGDADDGAAAEFAPQPVVLETSLVRLEPLTMDHAEDLWEAGKVNTLWRYLPVKPPRTIDDMRAWIGDALTEVEAGRMVAFATIHLGDKRAVGSTRYLSIERAHRGIEIGWTWIGIHYQRTAVNTHCKYLLLQHAFETLGAIRIQIKTDKRNKQSQKAIERIGAKREGVLRWHYIMPDGHHRDTIMYSITAKEWPEVKKHLGMRLL